MSDTKSRTASPALSSGGSPRGEPSAMQSHPLLEHVPRSSHLFIPSMLIPESPASSSVDLNGASADASRRSSVKALRVLVESGTATASIASERSTDETATARIDWSQKPGLFEAILQPLLGRQSSRVASEPFQFDSFQMQLFALLSNASDQYVDTFVQYKSLQLNRFLVSLFIASLHSGHPLRSGMLSDEYDKSSSKMKSAADLSTADDIKTDSSSGIVKGKGIPEVHALGGDKEEDIKKEDVKEDSGIVDASRMEATEANSIAGMSRLASHISVSDVALSSATESEPQPSAMPSQPELRQRTSSKELFAAELASDLGFDGDSSSPTPPPMPKQKEDDSRSSLLAEETREPECTSRRECEGQLLNEWTQLLKYGDGMDMILPLSATAAAAEERGTAPGTRESTRHSSLSSPSTDDSPVLVPESYEIEETKSEDTLMFSVKAELVAPMMRIRGQFLVHKEHIEFEPDEKQPEENNAHLGAELLTCSTLLSPESSTCLMPTTSYSTVSVPAADGTPEPGITSVSVVKTPIRSPLRSRSASDGSDVADDGFVLGSTKPALDRGKSVKETPAAQYWVCTTACSSFQHVGGNRYRVLNARQRWHCNDLTQMYARNYRLRKVAVELFFKDDTSWLFQFFEAGTRKKVFRAILSLNPKNLFAPHSSRLISMTVDKRMLASKSWLKPHHIIDKSKITYKWVRHEISNFEYLMQLNIIAGRTFNDLTQYPVMPCVLTDFTSERLNLKDPKVYRDLSKPIGALNEERLQSFVERYDSLMEGLDRTDAKEENNFMYGTHYSSIGVVLYYLIRMEPFTTYSKLFQGGRFDTADRLFWSVADSWRGSLTSTSDVKELIPEFFYLPDFLQNSHALDLGTKTDGTLVADVLLPPWANGDPLKFVSTMRDALESEYVSNNLQHWIDLIFGCKQRLPQALKSHNLFHPHTYEGIVDLDAIEDATQRAAILAQIDSFGQTPSQLFFKKHEKRMNANEVVSSMFKSRDIKHHGTFELTTNTKDGIGVSFLYLRDSDKALFAVLSDCTVQRHAFSAKNMRLEVKSKHSVSSTAAATFSRLFSSKTKSKSGGGKADKRKVGFGRRMCPLLNNRSLCYAVSEELQLLFASGFEDCSVAVWSLAKMHNAAHLCKLHSGIVSCVAADRSVLVTGSFDASVKVWDLKPSGGGEEAAVGGSAIVGAEPRFWFTRQIGKITCVDVSLKSGMIAVSDDSGECNLYSASTGDHLQKLMPFIAKMTRDPSAIVETGELNLVRVSQFGDVVCYSRDAQLLFAFSAKGALLKHRSVAGDKLYCLVPSKSAKYVLCGGTRTSVTVRHSHTLRIRTELKHAKSYIRCVALDKDEVFLFVGCANGQVLVYANSMEKIVSARIKTCEGLGLI